MVVIKGRKMMGGAIVGLWEPYVGGGLLTYSAFQIRLGTVGQQKEQQVTIKIVVITRNRLIVEARMDIMNHTYI